MSLSHLANQNNQSQLSPLSSTTTENNRPKAVVLLSGGLDSATCVAIAQAQGFDVYALSFRYGQRHEGELESATKIAQKQAVKSHFICQIDLGKIATSALTQDLKVPKSRSLAEMSKEIPITYVPARNTVFLSFALAWAESLDTRDIFIGVNALDYSGYPDCRPEYIKAFTQMANLGTKGGTDRPWQIHTPLIEMTKGQIIAKGLSLGVDYAITRTCYDPDEQGRACGHCDACLLRLKGFEENHTKDPAPYQDA
jgi:7-cyano-7-deazaguanine synthase